MNDKKNKGTAQVASFVMALEAINLIFQLSKPMTTLDQKLQVWGGACGLITANLELVERCSFGTLSKERYGNYNLMQSEFEKAMKAIAA